MAMASQRAACVYWPPFSRTPGGYPLMYPGDGEATQLRALGASCDWERTRFILF